MNTGGPEYPLAGFQQGPNVGPGSIGMTQRDAYAKFALMGLLRRDGALPTPAHAAQQAYAYADAMIAHRGP